MQRIREIEGLDIRLRGRRLKLPFVTRMHGMPRASFDDCHDKEVCPRGSDLATCLLRTWANKTVQVTKSTCHEHTFWQATILPTFPN